MVASGVGSICTYARSCSASTLEYCFAHSSIALATLSRVDDSIVDPLGQTTFSLSSQQALLQVPHIPDLLRAPRLHLLGKLVFLRCLVIVVKGVSVSDVSSLQQPPAAAADNAHWNMVCSEASISSRLAIVPSLICRFIVSRSMGVSMTS